MKIMNIVKRIKEKMRKINNNKLKKLIIYIIVSLLLKIKICCKINKLINRE